MRKRDEMRWRNDALGRMDQRFLRERKSSVSSDKPTLARPSNSLRTPFYLDLIQDSEIFAAKSLWFMVVVRDMAVRVQAWTNSTRDARRRQRRRRPSSFHPKLAQDLKDFTITGDICCLSKALVDTLIRTLDGTMSLLAPYRLHIVFARLTTDSPTSNSHQVPEEITNGPCRDDGLRFDFGRRKAISTISLARSVLSAFLGLLGDFLDEYQAVKFSALRGQRHVNLNLNFKFLGLGAIQMKVKIAIYFAMQSMAMKESEIGQMQRST
ncbi:hypothetical protein SCHPADRAFT_894014 [Schizopora paradoxa]|uniref:Uncharacterized protein n=1 Tax=Schizopora paradoxa TaxID=27342 RepID=A0A0H2RFC1_9AGAM|nr:hypothetical protein SCHPADRAFT_894014 [Schizopora paradoxa]